MILVELIYVLRMHLPFSYEIHDTSTSSREIETATACCGPCGGDERTGKHLVMLHRYSFFFSGNEF